jgi:drug/metabolite transporter (DMT)-like permease
LALVLLGEVPSLTSLIGGSIVVAGLAIATVGQSMGETAKRVTEP